MPTTVRFRRSALVVASVVTVAAVGIGVAASDARDTVRHTQTPVAARSAASLSAAASQASGGLRPTDERELQTTRSFDRQPLPTQAPREGKLWTTTRLDLRTQPARQAKVAGTVPPRQQVKLTGNRRGGFAEVIDGGSTRWVTASYLSKTKPEPPKPSEPQSPGAGEVGVDAGLSDAPCPDGSSIEGALQPASIKVYRAVCAAFPQLTSYGGQDGHGEHVNGEAIDFMVPDAETGEQVKDFVFAHHAELDLFDIIWSQHIWTIERSGEGFRSMPDRGSATANHMDHVHIKIN